MSRTNVPEPTVSPGGFIGSLKGLKTLQNKQFKNVVKFLESYCGTNLSSRAIGILKIPLFSKDCTILRTEVLTEQILVPTSITFPILFSIRMFTESLQNVNPALSNFAVYKWLSQKIWITGSNFSLFEWQKLPYAVDSMMHNRWCRYITIFKGKIWQS